MNPWAGLVEPLARALGWTLLHFCWQGMAVAASLWYVLRLLGGRLSQARYAAACVALLLMVALPLGTFQRLAQRELAARRVLMLPAVVIDADVIPAAGPIAPVPMKEQIKEALDRSAPWLPAVWLAGVMLFAVRLNLGLMVARRLQSSGTEPAPLELQHTLERLRARLGIARAVRLVHSAMVQVPTVIGWLRPVVLLPVSCLTGLSEMQIEAILAHELAHVRRHDYLVSVLQSVVETLLFYHPAVWWVSRQVRRERECCCDQLAVEHGGDVLAYARALSWLEERRAGTPAIVLGANGGVLKMRIKRLLGLREGPAVSLPAAITLTAVVLAGAAVYLGGVAHAEAKLKLRHSEPVALESMAGINAEISAAAGPARFTAFADGARQEAAPEINGGSPTKTRVYQMWLDEDVRWIITPAERDAFLKLTNDNERDQFIEQFWARRNPPGAAAGTFKEQHYERIAYANQHFGANGKPGWATDRGGIYIVYGKPDEIDAHPAGPRVYEEWYYKNLPGLGGAHLMFGGDNGDYHLTSGDLPGKAATVFAVSQTAAGGAQETGSIEGTLTGPTGAPVAGAHVMVCDTDTGMQVATQADNAGSYSFAGLPVGPYWVEFEAKGLQRTLQQNVRVAAGQNVGLNVKLAAAATTDGAIAGIIVDPAGARVAHAKMTAVNTDSGMTLHQVTDNVGSYLFSVPTGPYNVEVEAPGFQRMLQENVWVAAGQEVGLNLKLTVGAATQSLTVNGNAGGAGGAQGGGGASAPTVRISAGTAEGMAIRRPAPVYPAIAKAAHVQGVVMLHVVISKEGTVEDLQVLSGPPMLAQSAIDAARQWTYLPYLLNGKPVAVETTINVGFLLPPEALAATASQPQWAPPLRPTLPKPVGPIRISSGVAAGMAISMPQPVYPDEAKAAHVQGVVVLHALISKTGDIENLEVISGPEMLRQSAIDAASRWRYKPYLLNGDPTEVETTINIHFALDDTAKPQAGNQAASPATVPTVHVAAPTIRAIEYKGLNSVTISEVTQRFSQEGVGLRLETPYDAASVKRAVVVLARMLAEHSRPNAVIAISPRRIPPAGIGIRFFVDEGTKGTRAAKRVVTPAVGVVPWTGPSGPAAAMRPVRILAYTGPQPDTRQWDRETVRKIGDGVSPPMVIYQVEPEFTAEARAAKLKGLVLVQLIVDEQGTPRDVHMLHDDFERTEKNIQAIAGLDQEAVNTVRQYRFKPAMENGVPVTVELNVEVNFQIF